MLDHVQNDSPLLNLVRKNLLFCKKKIKKIIFLELTAADVLFRPFNFLRFNNLKYIIHIELEKLEVNY